MCIFVMLFISRLGFEGWIWVLIASVPDLCILFTFILSLVYISSMDIFLVTLRRGPRAENASRLLETRL